MTNAELTARVNELTGKNIKANSYSKAKLQSMIDAVAPTNLITPSDLAAATHRDPKSIRAWLRKNADKIDAKFQIKKHRFDPSYRDTLVNLITG